MQQAVLVGSPRFSFSMIHIFWALSDRSHPPSFSPSLHLHMLYIPAVLIYLQDHTRCQVYTPEYYQCIYVSTICTRHHVSRWSVPKGFVLNPIQHRARAESPRQRRRSRQQTCRIIPGTYFVQNICNYSINRVGLALSRTARYYGTCVNYTADNYMITSIELDYSYFLVKPSKCMYLVQQYRLLSC